MANSKTIKATRTTGILHGASLSLFVFWLLIILKGAYAPVKSALNFYPAVGPLLGGFVVGIAMFFVGMFLVEKYYEGKSAADVEKAEKTAVTVFIVSSVVIFFMTFPPIFEPIVHWLN